MKTLEKNKYSLSKYVPPYIYNEKTLNEVYKGQEKALMQIHNFIDDLNKQLFVNKATWGLDLWEEEFGIETNKSLPYEQRREQVKARKRGRGTCNTSMLKNVSEAFSGGECDILENTAPYNFTIKFVGVKGIPKNMEGLKKAINEIKPAHMLYNFQYTYTSWGELDKDNFSYDTIAEKTWDEIEII